VPEQHAAAVLALTRTIFSQPTQETAHEAVSNVRFAGNPLGE
jgi:hypothetical protein